MKTQETSNSGYISDNIINIRYFDIYINITIFAKSFIKHYYYFFNRECGYVIVYLNLSCFVDKKFRL